MSSHVDHQDAQFVHDDRSSAAVVFIGEGRLNPWHCERWGLLAMQRMGVDVLYLDAEVARMGGGDPRGMEEGIRAFADVRQMCSHLSRHYGRFLVLSPFHLNQGRFRFLAKFLAVRRLPWCLFDTVPIGITPNPSGAKQRLRNASFQARRILRRNGVLGGLRLVVDRVWISRRKVFGALPRQYDPQYVLLAGTAGDAAVAGPRAKRIEAHSQDYEHARKCGLLAPVAPQDHCVFVDQGEPTHPDWDAQGIPPSDRIDPRWYTEALLKCLSVIERETKLQVIILPHPRVAYEPGAFGMYKIVPGDTMGAIATARLVVGHYSTALGFAALFKKPLVLLNAALFRRIMAGRIDRLIRNFSAELGSPMLSMDDPSPAVLGNWRSIDEALYERYVARYLKYPGSADEPLWTGAVSFVFRDQAWPPPSRWDSGKYRVMPMSARHAEPAADGNDAV